MALLEHQATHLQETLDSLEQQRRNLSHRAMLLQRRLDMATEALHGEPSFVAGTNTVDPRAVPLQVSPALSVLVEGRPSKVPIDGAAVLQGSAALGTPDQLMDAFDRLVDQLGALSMEHETASAAQQRRIEQQLQQVVVLQGRIVAEKAHLVVPPQEQLHIAELALAAMMRDSLLLKHLILHMHGAEAIPLTEDVVLRLQPFLVIEPSVGG